MLSKRVVKLVLLIAVALGMQTSVSSAGEEFYFLEEAGARLLLSYFDTRERSTQVQVTNIDSIDSATIHVQIFADSFQCEDRDFTDTLTPNETHVYDISNLQSANGNPINFAIPDGSHGFVAISAAINNNTADTIIGNFRIIDDVGYEYRVNSAGWLEDVPDCQDRVGRFSMRWGANQADFIAVDMDDEFNTLADGTLDVTVDIPNITENELFVFDDEETGTSCGSVSVGCDEIPGDDPDEPAVFTAEFINQGINDVFPNSRGAGVLCSGDFNTEGYIRINSIEDEGEFFGYLGLNDGVERGSMDRLKVIDIGGECPPD